MKRRGYPDRRGMGSQSDFIVAPFVPSQQYKAQQKAMIRNLMDAGANPEQLHGMFLLPVSEIREKEPSDNEPACTRVK